MNDQDNEQTSPREPLRFSTQFPFAQWIPSASNVSSTNSLNTNSIDLSQSTQQKMPLIPKKKTTNVEHDPSKHPAPQTEEEEEAAERDKPILKPSDGPPVHAVHEGKRHVHPDQEPIVLAPKPEATLVERIGLFTRFLQVIEKIPPLSVHERRLQLWRFLVFLVVLYNSIVIPVELAFRDLWVDPSPWIFVIDYIGDIILILDIIVHFRTTFMQHGIVHSTTRKMAAHYLQNGFILDVLSAVPIDLFTFNVWKHALLRCLKFLRIRRFPVCF